MAGPGCSECRVEPNATVGPSSHGRAVAPRADPRLREAVLAQAAGAAAGAQVHVARPAAGGRGAGAVWRSDWESRGVLGPRGLGAGLECLHADHEAATAGRALIQRLAGELLETVAVVGWRVGRGRRHPQQPSAQGELFLAVTVGEQAEMPDAVEVARPVRRAGWRNPSLQDDSALQSDPYTRSRRQSCGPR